MAASSSSRGMPRKNWRNRKMLKALPKKVGTIRGRKLSTQPNLLNRMYWGSTVTWNGTMIVASTTKNRKVEPGARRRAKP